jgi:hypothetical protein
LSLLHLGRSSKLDVGDALSDKGVFIADHSDVQDLAAVLKVGSQVFLVDNPGQVPNKYGRLEIIAFLIRLSIEVNADVFISNDDLIKLLCSLKCLIFV